MSSVPPFTRSGRSSLVPEGPWIYGLTGISAHVKVDQESIREVLPKGVEPVDGDALLYISEIVSVSERWPELNIEAPDLVQYHEATILIRARYGGKTYLYCPYMWVDTDLSLMRGYLAGFPKKIAKIHLTKHHPSIPGFNGPKSGAKLGGYAARSSYLLFRIAVTLKEKAETWPLDDVDGWLLPRCFPAPAPTLASVKELVELRLSYIGPKVVWRGDVELKLGGGVNDELFMFKPLSVVDGYYFQIGLRIDGLRALSTLRVN